MIARVLRLAGRAAVIFALVGLIGCGEATNGSNDADGFNAPLDWSGDDGWSLPDPGTLDPGPAEQQERDQRPDNHVRDQEVLDTDAEAGTSCEPGAAGCRCKGNDDCDSGYCGWHLGEKICAQVCVDTCEPGWTCTPVQVGGEPIYVCVSDFPHLCLPCTTNNDCRFVSGSTDVCVRYAETEGSFCGGACATADDCPAGYTCEDVETVDGSPVRQCMPESGTCACTATAIASAFSTPCSVTNAWGACKSTRVCSVDGLPPCDAATPAEEVCYDLADNDCDSLVDADDKEQCEVPCVCGDGTCEPDRCGERWDDQQKTCAADCTVCGNGLCDPGEGPVKCPVDCCGGCGDGVCKGGECGEGPGTCPQDCTDYVCGDTLCDPAENAVDCPEDCLLYACGNHTCEPGEDADACPLDCEAACGDCECSGGESYTTCPIDCGYCGDGYCIGVNQPGIDESCVFINEDDTNCPADCCVPNCTASDGTTKQCGDDGCGGLCGKCVSGYECTDLGTCVCAVMGDDADCNGVDDDCDGVVDDHFPVQATTCGIGVCASAGERGCVQGAVVDTCFAGEATGGDATCDGLDDDCDGATDEHFASVPTTCGVGTCARTGQTTCNGGFPGDSCLSGDAAANDATCNAVDDDCDGQTDEDFVMVPTACGNGVCARTGTTTCVSGVAGDSCEAGQTSGNDTDCNGMDEDCDGATDEHFVPVATTCGVGACARTGHTMCTDGVKGDSCVAGAPISEACNGADDDCNGQTDEELGSTTCGKGICQHTVQNCVGGVQQGCDPFLGAIAETCNGEDDDCDGLTDATDPDVASKDVQYCSQQSGVCSRATKPVSLCADGAWQACTEDTYAAWSPFYEHGAETVCDGLDNDCDGTTDDGGDALCPNSGESCAGASGCFCDHADADAGFRRICAGSFWMGSPADSCPSGQTCLVENCPDGYPGACLSEQAEWCVFMCKMEWLHYVELTHGFEMGAREVTQGEWKATYGGWNPSHFLSCGDTCPVEQVNWYDAAAYANAKSVAAGKTACYAFAAVTCLQGGDPEDATDYGFCMDATHAGIRRATVTLTGAGTSSCTGYRLPTEAEWEYAYRSGSVTAFYPSAGNDGSIKYSETDCEEDYNLDKIGWYCGNSSNTTHVTGSGGGKEANAWGLYDMAGNVYEWCWDWYAEYDGGTYSNPKVDPTGPAAGSSRMLRGGSWHDFAWRARAAARSSLSSDYYTFGGTGGRFDYIGFRLARSYP